MFTRRVVFITALAFSALFYVLYPYWFSGYLFVVLLLLIPFDLIASLPGMLTKRVVISAPGVMEQGAEGKLAITTVQKKNFPARCIKLRIRHITGDDKISVFRMTCGARRGSRSTIAVETKHCGVSIYDIKRARVVSLIGLFAVSRKINRRVSVLVLPTPVIPLRVATLPRGIVFRPKPGGGFSEDYDLRPYRLGDQIRSIHWKLSAKVGSLIVREPMVPPPHSRLVETTIWNDARERDLVLGRLRWVSDYLLKWEMPFYVKIGESGPITEIRSTKELVDCIFRTLDCTSHKAVSPPYLPARFAWVFHINAREAENREPQVTDEIKGA